MRPQLVAAGACGLRNREVHHAPPAGEVCGWSGVPDHVVARLQRSERGGRQGVATLASAGLRVEPAALLQPEPGRAHPRGVEAAVPHELDGAGDGHPGTHPSHHGAEVGHQHRARLDGLSHTTVVHGWQSARGHPPGRRPPRPLRCRAHRRTAPAHSSRATGRYGVTLAVQVRDVHGHVAPWADRTHGRPSNASPHTSKASVIDDAPRPTTSTWALTSWPNRSGDSKSTS